jgi:hypothetical protein
VVIVVCTSVEATTKDAGRGSGMNRGAAVDD